MFAYRFILSTIFQICLFISGTAAFTQQRPGQWIGNLYCVRCDSPTFKESSILIDENNKIQKIIPNIVLYEDFFELYHKSYRLAPSLWHNGTLHSMTPGCLGNLEKNKNVYKSEGWTLAEWQYDQWQSVGCCKKSLSTLLKAIPCDYDRFIVVLIDNDDMDSKNRSKITPFHRMSITSDKTEFIIDKAIDHGQDTLDMANPKHFELAYYSEIIMTDRHATLLNTNTGLYWIFSLENASLVKTGNIFKEETAKILINNMITKDPDIFNPPILCVNPEKKGTVLIAAQDERFFLAETRSFRQEYYELLNTKPYRSMSDEDILKKLYYPLQKEFVNRSPNIVWYRIYPETGEVKKLKEPPAGGSNLRDEMNYSWRPMPDGSVGSVGNAPGHFFLRYSTFHEAVEKQLIKRIADFSPGVRRELLKNMLEEELEKLRRNGFEGFSSLITVISKLKQMVTARVENHQLRPNAEKALKADLNALENEAKAEIGSKEKAEFEKDLKNSIAAEQKNKKAPNNK